MTPRQGSLTVDPSALLEEVSPEERALQKVIRVVNLREQSTVTMQRKLQQAGFDEEIIESTLTRACELGLIDNRRYAEAFVRAALSSGKGMRSVRRELESLGVELEEVEAYQDYCDEGSSEVERALVLLSHKRFTAKNRQQAAYRTLVGKGYSSDVASTAARLWAEQE